MDTREKFLSLMHGNPGSHSLKWEFGYWAQTLRRWYTEGLSQTLEIPPEITDGTGLWAEACNWTPGYIRDIDVHSSLGMDNGMEGIPIHCFIHPLFERKVLESHNGWELVQLEDGNIARELKNNSSLPRYIQGPIRGPEDWEKLRSERLQPDWRARLQVPKWDAWKQQYEKRAFPLCLSIGHGFYSALRTLLGDVQALYAFYDQPEMVRDIVNYLADFWIAIFDPLLAEINVDCVLIWEDMAYRAGPLISPKMFREFLLAPYQKLTSCFRSHSIDIILVDSDGDVRPIIPLFLEGGVTGLYPFETTNGQNVIEIRRQFPTMHILGGIDKKAIASGKSGIDAQFNWLSNMLTQGRYVPYLDHDVPPDISWEDFKYYRTKLNTLVETVAVKRQAKR